MWRHGTGLYAGVPELLKKFRRKMQSGSRSCRRAQFLCVNSLITLPILKLLGDIRRKRHIANAVEQVEKVGTLVFKTHNTGSVLGASKHLCTQ